LNKKISGSNFVLLFIVMTWHVLPNMVHAVETDGLNRMEVVIITLMVKVASGSKQLVLLKPKRNNGDRLDMVK
jgi:hypothetical protein